MKQLDSTWRNLTQLHTTSHNLTKLDTTWHDSTYAAMHKFCACFLNIKQKVKVKYKGHENSWKRLWGTISDLYTVKSFPLCFTVRLLEEPKSIILTFVKAYIKVVTQYMLSMSLSFSTQTMGTENFESWHICWVFYNMILNSLPLNMYAPSIYISTWRGIYSKPTSTMVSSTQIKTEGWMDRLTNDDWGLVHGV